MVARIEDAEGRKSLRSPDYNYHFNKRTGLFVRWGETLIDNPEWSPYGPEIADIEISTGDCSMNCPWCYKANNPEPGRHMSLATFERVLDKLPDTLTQVAFGITDADANPDFVPMIRACRERGIVPNYTTSGAGMSDEVVMATAELCGAVAVSVYPHNEPLAWWSVGRFIRMGMKQVNIHLLYHAGNEEFVRRVLNAATKVDGLNAVVLLGLKPIGRAKDMAPMGQEAFNDIVSSARVPIGFDSCSAPKFARWAVDNNRQDQLVFTEPCESSLFSVYINVDGIAYPCSFGERPSLAVDILDADDFVSDVWESRPFTIFRKDLLANGRRCPLYKLEGG